MKKVVDYFLINTDIGNPINYENLTVVPIFSKLRNKLKYISLTEAVNNSMAKISEIDTGGSVPELLVINESDTEILIYEGEELKGAKQNRVVNTSVLLNKKSKTIIPVSCVEQGRWSYDSNSLLPSDYSSPRNIRISLKHSVSNNLEKTLEYKSDQHEVWNLVEETADENKVYSKTEAMHDIYENKSVNIKLFTDYLKPIKGQKGMIVLINGEIVGLEFISRKSVFRDVYKKLISSYVLEAINKKKNDRKDDIQKNLNIFFKQLKSSKEKGYNGVALGKDYRISSKGLLATALVYEDQLICFSSQNNILFN